MPDAQPPRVITPEAREVIQGIYAAAQNEGTKIAGLAEVQSIEDTLVGSQDDPTNLGPTVEVSVPLDADGNPIPQIEDRSGFQPASGIMTIRVTPTRAFGGDFYSAHIEIADVTTGRAAANGRTGATTEEREALEDGRPESEYGNDPAFSAGLLALEDTTVEGAVATALRRAFGNLDLPFASPAGAPTAGPVAPPTGASETSDGWLAGIPGGWKSLVAGAVVLVVGGAAVVSLAGGGDGDESPSVAIPGSGGTSVQSGTTSASGTSAASSDGGGAGEGSVAVFVAEDESDDIGPQASDLTAIEDPSLAGDIVRVSAEVDADANETQLMIWFAGDAQMLQASSGAELGAGVLVKPADGSRGLDLIYKTDGSSKGSDPPAGFSLSVSWYQSDVLLFAIGGYAPPSGSVVEFQTFQTENFAFSSDRATLTIDEDGDDFLRYGGEFGGLRVE